MTDVPAEQRGAVLNLLKDLAESEHQIRHRAGFAALCAAVGMAVVQEPSRVTVEDPQAVEAPDPATED